MRHRHTPVPRTALAGAGAAALVITAVLLPGAAVATVPASAHHAPTAQLASTLTARLGSRAAGSYYDAHTARLVVNITAPAAADSVRAAGAVPQVVRYSSAQLQAVTTRLGRQAHISGTAWAVDPRKNKVVVTADPTVTGAHRAQLDKVVAALGDKVELRRTASPFKVLLAGGDAIWGSTVRCSLGFNVSVNGAPYFLTAGHCGNASPTWSDSFGGAETGQTVNSHFPGNDYALVQYDNPSAAPPSTVDLYNGGTQQITQAANAYVGEPVQRSGSTTGVHGGTVTGLNATVNYQQGTVTGLIDTNVCAEPGDSGGALFDGSSAIGLTSGGSGNCTTGGETFFQPVTAALSAEGAVIPGAGTGPDAGITRAFQGTNGHLWIATASGARDLGLAMKAGTRPSIATVSTGGHEVAYQGSNGDLWVASVNGPAYDSHLGMMSGTSPAIAAAASGGFNVAFQADTGVLWDYTSATGRGTSLNQPMVTTSSPSITAPVGAVGGYEIAYQGSNIDLWVTTITGTPIDSHLGMMSGTSPSIAAAASGGFNVAFQANSGMLWDYTSATGRGTSLNQPMVTTSSPSITAPVGAVGGYEIAYQGSNIDLWVTTISGTPIDSHLGMASGTSPSIAAAPTSGFNAAFQANTGMLWDYTSTTGRGVSLNQPMASGTSPGLAQ